MSLLDHASRSRSTSEGASAASRSATNRSSVRILVADRDRVSRRALEDMVRCLGYACDFADDGEQVYERCLVIRPDIVIVDWALPGPDGREFCRRIRESSVGRCCYVIAIGARADYDAVLAGMRAGADDCLTKPLRRGELESRLIVASRVADLRARLAARDANLASAKAGASGGARRDPLTGLGNRLGLSEHLAALDAKTRRYGHSYCIALCELDGRKRHDARGSDVADDHILSVVGRALRGECRGTDFAYRPGGEEIVVVLPDRTPQSAGMALERMRRAVQALAIPDSDDSAAVVTMSAGLATRGARGESCRHVLRRASAALDEAEARGRNCVVVDTDADAGASEQGRTSFRPALRRFAPGDDRLPDS